MLPARMSQLNVIFDNFLSSNPTVRKTSDILSIFLQAGSDTSVGATTDKFLTLLADKNNRAFDTRLVINEFIRVAEQIPYHHRFQTRIVDLLESILNLTQSREVYIGNNKRILLQIDGG